MNVLVTGMSGLIGSAFLASHGDDYSVSALNRSKVNGVPTTRASLDNYEAIRPAFDDQQVVVHLAAKIDDSFGWEELHKVNVLGTRNVLAAAADAGVKRVVFASSGATVAGWERLEPYKAIVEGRYGEVQCPYPLVDESMATRPSNQYAATKVWGESIARYYADHQGLEVISLRIGFANEADRPEAARQFSVWNSQRDVVQALRLSIHHTMDDNFDNFFILSDNEWAYRDTTRAQQVLGFSPADSAEYFR